MKQSLTTCLFLNNTNLLAETELMLKTIVDKSNKMCKKRKLKVDGGTSKVILFGKAMEKAVNFAGLYRVKAESMKK